MNYRFSPEARVDLLAAADFYEGQRAGLGAEFSVDVGIAVARVLEAPQRWPEMELGIRRFRLDRSLRDHLSCPIRADGRYYRGV